MVTPCSEHDGTSKLTLIASAYFAVPPADTDYGIIFVTDIFGYEFVNSQLVADSFAANGYIPPLLYSRKNKR